MKTKAIIQSQACIMRILDLYMMYRRVLGARLRLIKAHYQLNSKLQRRLLGLNLTITTTRPTLQARSLRRWHLLSKIDLRAVRRILIITRLTVWLSSDWRRFGLSIRTGSCRRKGGRRSRSKYWTSGLTREQGRSPKFNVKWSSRTLQLILLRHEASQGQTSQPKGSSRGATRLKWTPRLMIAISMPKMLIWKNQILLSWWSTPQPNLNCTRHQDQKYKGKLKF